MSSRKDQANEDLAQVKRNKKEENWLDDVMEVQNQDLEEEEEILSTVPTRIRHKWIDIDDE